MFGMNQPSLRHHAVLERVSMLKLGAIWKVQDRRNAVIQKFLLVPSKAKPWPILLEILKNFQPSPIRLRNGKVGLLLTSSEIIPIKNVLRKIPREPYELDAMNGFRVGRKPKWIKPISVSLVLIFVALLTTHIATVAKVTHTSPQRIQIKNAQTEICAIGIPLGARMSPTVKPLSRISFGETHFVVASAVRFGGLTQFKAKRTCDGKYFRFDAWKGDGFLEVSKLY